MPDDMDEIIENFEANNPPSEWLTPAQLHRFKTAYHGGSPIGDLDDIPDELLEKLPDNPYNDYQD